MTGSLADVEVSANDEAVQQTAAVDDKPKPAVHQGDTTTSSTADTTDATTEDDAASLGCSNDITVTVAPQTLVLTREQQAAVLTQAKEYHEADQVLAAARLIRQLPLTHDDSTVSLTAEHRQWVQHVLDKAELLQQVIHDLLSDPEQQQQNDDNKEEDEEDPVDWQKLGQTRSDIALYYCWIVDPETQHRSLKCRIESPIESSLLTSVLATLVETELYTTWIPTWNMPKIGLVGVDKLAQIGRTEQVIHFLSQVPWPLKPKDAVVETMGCDDIHDIDNNNNNASDDHRQQKTTGTIAIKLRSVDEANKPDNVTIPPPATPSSRAYFDGGMLIRACPHDHFFAQERRRQQQCAGSEHADNDDEHLLLVGFTMHVDANISPVVPATILNFIIQTCIKSMWGKFLHVAEEIRDGKRPQHTAAIESKREELYNWIESRIEAMFSHLASENNQQKQTCVDEEGNKRDGEDECFDTVSG